MTNPRRMQMAAGGGASAEGELYSWGESQYGALGNGTASPDLSAPAQVGGLNDWAQLASWSKGCGAVKTDGTLWAWGDAGFGATGQGNTTDMSSPVQIGSLTNWSTEADKNDGSADSWHMIKTDGTLWALGGNGNGNLGDGSTTNRNSPVQIGSLTTWSKIFRGGNQVMGITTGGTMFTWGFGGFGNLGHGNTTYLSSPVQVGSGTTWVTGAAGAYALYGIKSDGTLWSCGYNYHGQLGIGNTTATNTFGQIGSLTNWAKVSGRGQGASAVKTDGTLWGWGSHYNGGSHGLGDTSYSSPVQVGSLTNWAGVFDNSGDIGFAIKTDGTLWGMGGNADGNLGDGSTTNRNSPVQVGTDTWAEFHSSDDTSYGIRA